jgi:hypothetical protein
MPALNPVFLQRLAKVLHCCMLRLPSVGQREICGRAVVALQRLALTRFRGRFAQPVPAMPVPLIDCSTLMTVPVASAEAPSTSDDASWRDLTAVGLHRQSQGNNAELSLLQEWATNGTHEVRLCVLYAVHFVCHDRREQDSYAFWHSVVLAFGEVCSQAFVGVCIFFSHLMVHGLTWYCAVLL